MYSVTSTGVPKKIVKPNLAYTYRIRSHTTATFYLLQPSVSIENLIEVIFIGTKSHNEASYNAGLHRPIIIFLNVRAQQLEMKIERTQQKSGTRKM